MKITKVPRLPSISKEENFPGRSRVRWGLRIYRYCTTYKMRIFTRRLERYRKRASGFPLILVNPLLFFNFFFNVTNSSFSSVTLAYLLRVGFCYVFLFAFDVCCCVCMPRVNVLLTKLLCRTFVQLNVTFYFTIVRTIHVRVRTRNVMINLLPFTQCMLFMNSEKKNLSYF